MTADQKVLRKFAVIEGGGSPLHDWQILRSFVAGRSAFDPNKPVFYRLSRRDLARSQSVNRLQPTFDAWSVILGEPPPVPNICMWDDALQIKTLTRLADATSCFRGIRRPQGNDDNGWDTVVFISKPKWIFSRRVHMACAAELTEVPADLVFATYVKLDKPERNSHSRGGPEAKSSEGVITHWDFIEADERNNHMPAEFDVRYRRRMW